MSRKTVVIRRPTRLPEWDVLCPNDIRVHVVRQMGQYRTCDCDQWYRSNWSEDKEKRFQCRHIKAVAAAPVTERGTQP